MFRRTIIGMALLAVAMSSQVMAQEGKKKQSKRGQRIQAITQLKGKLAEIDLTEEQSKKVEEIIAKHKEALTATAAKRRELVNADANKKMAEARKAAQSEGKKGKDLQAAVMAASGLSEEDQKKLAAISQETQKVAAVMKQEVAKILSEEQREKTGLQMKKGRKKNKK